MCFRALAEMSRDGSRPPHLRRTEPLNNSHHRLCVARLGLLGSAHAGSGGWEIAIGVLCMYMVHVRVCEHMCFAVQDEERTKERKNVRDVSLLEGVRIGEILEIVCACVCVCACTCLCLVPVPRVHEFQTKRTFGVSSSFLFILCRVP
jgi:hypothetical protein